MVNQRLKLTLALASALLAGHSAAQDAVDTVAEPAAEPIDLPDGFEILERHAEAIGGAKRYKELVGLKMTGSIKVQGMEATAKALLHFQAPSNSLMQIDLGEIGSAYMGTNGLFGWTSEPNQEAEIMPADSAAPLLDRSSFYSPVEPRNAFISAKTAAVVEYEGTKCYKVELVSRNNSHKIGLYDVQTGLLRKLTIHDGDEPMQIFEETEYLDYTLTEGVRFAHTHIITNPLGRRHVISLHSVELNPQFEEGLFDPPVVF